MSNDFDSFSNLPEILQFESLREGEARLQAQLQVATAADQRALTWGGLLVAAATGALGGGLALIGKNGPDYALGLLAIGFSFSMMIAAWTALRTVQPKQFRLPGNRPANWLPEEWDCVGTEGRKVQQARREQAEQFNKHILENAETAKQRAREMGASFALAKRTVFVGGVALLIVVAYRLIESNIDGITQAFAGCSG